MKRKTELSLLSRGFDADTARNIASKGYSLGKLLQESEEKLNSLGIADELITKLKTEKRPPIPVSTINSLLYQSACTCCVCRNKANPIIVHHLTEWSVSRNHEINNLAVLCLICHDKAHSKSTISQNLTSEYIAIAKDKWEITVKENEARAIFTKTSWNPLNGFWDYFNHTRIVDTVLQLGLDPTKVTGYDFLSAYNLVNPDGSYVWPQDAPRKEDLPFMYEGGARGVAYARSAYYSNLVREILLATNFIHLTNNFTKSVARNLLHNNDIVCVTGGHRFKSHQRLEKDGPGQMRLGYRQGNGLRLAFNFDGWECTSSSSHSVNLRGMWRCTSISIVRSIEFGQKNNTVNCTCLAIGTGFTDYFGTIPSVAYENEVDDEWDEFSNDDEEV